MKLNKLIISSIAIAAAFSLQGAVQEGLWEVNVSGSYSSMDVQTVDLDMALFSGSAGYFVTNNIQVGGMLTYMNAEVLGEDLTAVMLGTAADYHFNTQSTFVPFVGAAFYYVDVDVDGLGSDNDWAWEARAGVKQFVAENVAITYKLAYMDFDELEMDGITVSLGLSFLF